MARFPQASWFARSSGSPGACLRLALLASACAVAALPLGVMARTAWAQAAYADPVQSAFSAPRH